MGQMTSLDTGSFMHTVMYHVERYTQADSDVKHRGDNIPTMYDFALCLLENVCLCKVKDHIDRSRVLTIQAPDACFE